VSNGLKLDVRRRKILDLLRRNGTGRIPSLSETLGSSAVTIRNDLSELEKEGFLERIPGGAVQTMKNYYNMDFQQRKVTHSLEKQLIAETAASLVKDGETLMINAGTTGYFTAIELKRYKHLKIVTNSIMVSMELSGQAGIHVTLLGGEASPQYMFTYGTDALKQLKQYKADKVILSVDGINPATGLSTYHAEGAEIMSTMLERSFCSVVVADSTKVGHESFSNIGDISSVNYLVTDGESDETILDEFRAMGIDTMIAGEENAGA